MGAIIAAVMGFFAEMFAKQGLIEVAKWLAYKAVIVALMFTGGWILYTIIVSRTWDIAIELIKSRMPADGSYSGLIQFTGFTAWLMECSKIPQMVSVLISAVTVKTLLRMIPFVSPVK